MTDDSSLTFDRRTATSGDVVEARGELDLTNVQSLTDVVAGTSTRTVILDLGGLTFVDSAGIRAIDQAHRRLASEGRVLLVVAPSDSRAAWTFRVAGFGDRFALGSMEAALLRAAEDDA